MTDASLFAGDGFIVYTQYYKWQRLAPKRPGRGYDHNWHLRNLALNRPRSYFLVWVKGVVEEELHVLQNNHNSNNSDENTLKNEIRILKEELHIIREFIKISDKEILWLMYITD